ncbi:MAG: aldo/keto reductase [Bacillota bacterium]|nr:aldo/keto reductase [Bacillota bacterium]
MMYKTLGNTGLRVSEICFGTLPMGPLQYNIPFDEGVELIQAAAAAGINYFDAAQNYRTYRYLREALKDCSSEVIISTKSKAFTFSHMDNAVHEALRELDRDYIDIFFIHGDKAGKNVFNERRGAWENLIQHKKKGTIRYIGLSTHSVEAVREAVSTKEVDVIFPLINMSGLGIIDGDRTAMIDLIEKAAFEGKGTIAMKIFGGGHLLKDREKAFDFIKNQTSIDCIAVGMVNKKELEYNLALFAGEKIPEKLKAETLRSKKLVVTSLCIGCGSCARVCPTGAMTIKEDKAEVETTKCLLCGYCVSSCKQIAIRVI